MVYVTGSLAFDYIMDFPGKFADQIVPEKLHLINISFLVDNLRESKGGTAGNIAYNLALLGEKVSIVACGGRDFSLYKKFLTHHRIETRYIKIIKNDYTAKAYITTDRVDNQITGFYPGAMRFDKVLKLPPYLNGEDFVVISPTDPQAMHNFVNCCTSGNIPFLFDPGMQLPKLSVNTLESGINNGQIIIGNDYEIALLKKKLSIKKWKWQKKDQIIVTTLGGEGCFIETKKEKIIVPPSKPKNVIDPTGAGDAFRAGFLAGFLNKMPFVVCGKMGNLAAVYTVEKYGTTTHKFSLAEFKDRYFKNYREKLKTPRTVAG